MEEELNYISKRIEDIECRIDALRNNKLINESEGYKAILKDREKELVLLKNIENDLTINELGKSNVQSQNKTQKTEKGLDYLKNVIFPQRKKEIADGLNAGTRQPVYVVFNLDYLFIGGHNVGEWMNGSQLNYKDKPHETGYFDMDLDSDDREFLETKTGMTNPEAVTKLYYDRVVSFFLTRKGAEDYLEYQSHNLSDAYVCVFYSGYSNREMDAILCGN